MRIGAHQSVAGGLHRAWEWASQDGCEALQIFTKSSNQWREPSLGDDDTRAFREARARSPAGSAPVLAHDSYLINLCTPDAALRERSRDALLAEAVRCESLGIENVVLHPGAHMGTGIDAGVERVVEQLAWVLDRTRGARVALLVENTAGQGSAVASRLPEIAAILRGVDATAGDEARRRVGVCFDTCHAFAAGYDLRTPCAFDEVAREIEQCIGLGRVRAVHVNDAKKELGCRVDRHERIGLGTLGLYPFWRLMNDPRFEHVVGVLETPPDGEDRAYRAQLETLRAMIGAEAPEAPGGPAAPEATGPGRVVARARPAKRARRS
jgi:deoxyribonuclease-4